MKARIQILAVLTALSALTLVGTALPPMAAAEGCPNEVFRSGPSAHLPDCRAYEQVTPVYKNGGLFVLSELGVTADGEPTAMIESFAAIDGLEDDASVYSGFYATRRGEAGWVSSATPPPASQYEVVNPRGYITPLAGASIDDSSTLWIERAKTWSGNRVDFVSRAGGVVSDIGPVTPPGTPAASPFLDNDSIEGVEPAGFSNDLSHIFFEMDPSESYGGVYWPFDGTKSGGRSLLEYVGTDNTVPLLVGVDNAGDLISACGTELGAPKKAEMHNAVSADGSTVFFTAVACGSSPRVDELFARVDNGLPDAHTVAISEPSEADCPTCDTGEGVLQPASFEGASRNGSIVFFTTSQPMLGGDTSPNIYEYDFEPPVGQPKVVRVSGGDATVTDPTAEVEGVVRTSEDGSHVYFVARGILTKTANGRGQIAHKGNNNLYVFERDAQYPGGRTEFIADLSEADNDLWQEDVRHPADATPNGDFLVFTATTDLTSDDTGAASQVFEYDAQTGALVRISIGEDGYDDNGNAEEAETFIASPRFGDVSDPKNYLSGLSVSADGSYVFFASNLALTPQAINRKTGTTTTGEQATILNIYEYHAGNVYLISDGQDIGGSTFLVGTDESGRDVFFSTVDRLVPQDTDTDTDYYDARIDGGFPAPAAPLECSGDGCQGPLSAAPVLLSPGSEFQAGGNPTLATLASTDESKPPAKTKRKTKAKSKRKQSGRKAKRAIHRGRAGEKGGRS